MKNILFHIHSKYSYDSFMEPKKIVDMVRNLGYKGVAIVDHGNINGGREAKKYASSDFEVLVCGEYRTQYGDIIGVGLTENITASTPEEVVSQIHKQGGKAVWAHPCRTYLVPRGDGRKKPLPPKSFIKSLDYIETYNAQTKPSQNAQAQAIAREFALKEISGLDAHFYFEIKKTNRKSYSLLGYLGSFVIKQIKSLAEFWRFNRKA